MIEFLTKLQQEICDCESKEEIRGIIDKKISDYWDVAPYHSLPEHVEIKNAMMIVGLSMKELLEIKQLLNMKMTTLLDIKEYIENDSVILIAKQRREIARLKEKLESISRLAKEPENENNS